LGGAWVAQGWPKPNPKQAEGRKSLPVLANCQLLAARFSKIFAFHTLRRCWSISISFAHINRELIQGLDKWLPEKRFGAVLG
jgi:hypothetical protein